MKILIVGAGVAGLVCGRTLLRAGHEVAIFEASDAVGGRVRSDVVDGFTLDRGFQVLFTAYPAAKRQLDYPRLDLRSFEPGALIAQAARRAILSDPLRDPGAFFPAVLTDIVPLVDKLRTAILTRELIGTSVEAIMAGRDETTEAFLRRKGFSERYLDNFIRPFFGGVFLDSRLQTSAKAFQFDWKMLSEGETVVPARGIGQISEQLGEELMAAGSIYLNHPVTALKRDGAGRVTGVLIGGVEAKIADAVVVATAAPEAGRLTGQSVPIGQVGTLCLFFAGDAPVFAGRKVALHANQDAFVNNAAQLTNVAPTLAPAGRHLLSASVLGVPDGDNTTLFDRARSDLRRMFAGDRQALSALQTYRPLALYRIPYGQFAQPPGIYPTLPGNRTTMPGLYLAGEFTAASSLNAAMRSGEKCAAAILASAD
ncbi:MAG: FAD-dependent oxidoreductase [Cytophagales bacterium]|nr:FAD-dependent oxidoreductase [Armatimonadota bacterium]